MTKTVWFGLCIFCVSAGVLGYVLWVSAIAQTIPSNWTTYQDPNSYFSLQLPPGWVVERTDSQAYAGRAFSN